MRLPPTEFGGVGHSQNPFVGLFIARRHLARGASFICGRVGKVVLLVLKPHGKTGRNFLIEEGARMSIIQTRSGTKFGVAQT